MRTKERRMAVRLGAMLVALIAVPLATGCGGDGTSGAAPGTQVDAGGNDQIDVGFGVDGATQPDGEVDAPVAGEPLGSACESDGDCVDGECVTDALFPGGFCTAEGCVGDGDCGTSGVCVPGLDGSFCAPTCENVLECRNGYVCADETGAGACVPEALGAAVDGASCGGDNDCRGGTCINQADWPEGYCTTLYCENFEDCASDGEDNRCLLQRGGTNFCVRICTDSSECRQGYICQGIGGDLGYCAPNPFQPLDIDPDSSPLDITCQQPDADGIVSFDFDVHADSTSYMVTPYASDGYWLYPTRITLPDGERIELRGENEFLLTGAMLFGYLNPTVVPAIAAFAGQLQSGEHSYWLETESEQICHYVLQESTPGTTLDINVYLVGVPGLDAESAPDDPNMAAVLDTFESIYAAAGIEIGELRFFDVTGDDEDRYSIVRSEADVDALATLTRPPGDTLDDVLSVNVFFVRAMAFEDGGGAIGISSGLPGPAGLHGTGASGVVFTSEFFGQELEERGGDVVDGDQYTGVVFAHEVGHYLGLFHSSEQFGQGFDPLQDTPECRSDFPWGCGDLNNLMFPFAGISHVEVTEDQAWVIGVNPLTKE